MAEIADYVIKGFVADTAFYKADFDGARAISGIDQGVCCITDAIENKVGEPCYIQDPRDTRLNGDDITANGSVISPGGLVGKMVMMFDAKRLTDEVRAIFDDPVNQPILKNLFDAIELTGNHQRFDANGGRTGTLLTDSVIVNKISNLPGISLGDGDFIQNPQFSIKVEAEHESGKEIRIVRKYVQLKGTFSKTSGEETTSLTLTFDLWFDRDAFAEQYPWTTITDVILPCPCGNLYDILGSYQTVSAFVSAASEGKKSVFHLTGYTFDDDVLENVTGNYDSGTIDSMVASDDHSGVAQFTTDYYAYPDTQPTNFFSVTFGVAYKGAKPSVDVIRAAIRAAILCIVDPRIDPRYAEELWKKKLPDIFSDREFVLVPLWDTAIDGGGYRGIVDTTPSAVRKILQDTVTDANLDAYVAQIASDVELLVANNLHPPVFVIPVITTLASDRKLSKRYTYYKGVYGDGEEGSDSLEFMITTTLAKAYETSASSSAKSGFKGKYQTFTHTDGTTFYIKCRNV